MSIWLIHLLRRIRLLSLFLLEIEIVYLHNHAINAPGNDDPGWNCQIKSNKNRTTYQSNQIELYVYL